LSSRDKIEDLILKVKKLRAESAPDQEIAEFIARAVHSGPSAIDANGVPYIQHPRRVSNIVAALFHEHSKLEADAYSTAWLHDVIEDSERHFGEQVTQDDLLVMGFSPEVVIAVGLLSKEENYVEDEYLDRIAENEIARIVKFADLADNTSPVRRSGLNDKLRNRYTRYWTRLLQEGKGE
jgi:(p)ppGpp synthase/HD superfamily hydrolase